MNPLTAIAIVVVLAVLGELIIEALKPALRPIIKRLHFPEDIDAYLYLSLVLGVVLALLFEADLLKAIGLESPYAPAIWFQRVVTGLLVGRGANFVHKAIERLSDATGRISVQTSAPKDADSRTQVSVSSQQDAEG